MTQTEEGKAADRSNLASLEVVLEQQGSDLDAFRSASGSFLSAASDFWHAPMASGHLSPRMKELVLVGIHASVATFNVEAVERHVKRSLEAGATASEVMDVLITIVGLANHALYVSVPILEEELIEAATVEIERAQPSPEYDAAKQAFIEARGFWDTRRDLVAELLPDYYKALDRVSTESWKTGPLTAKERAFVCIGIDATVNHTFEPGLRRHIRNALQHGATAGELLDVLQLTGMIGLESFILGGRVLFGRS